MYRNIAELGIFLATHIYFTDCPFRHAEEDIHLQYAFFYCTQNTQRHLTTNLLQKSSSVSINLVLWNLLFSLVLICKERTAQWLSHQHAALEIDFFTALKLQISFPTRTNLSDKENAAPSNQDIEDYYLSVLRYLVNAQSKNIREIQQYSNKKENLITIQQILQPRVSVENKEFNLSKLFSIKHSLLNCLLFVRQHFHYGSFCITL